jgi:D-tyrosyl-tRNA(Tyr) deacylase
MRALVQRVTRAGVRVDGRQVADIGPGLLVLLGVSREDDEAAADRLAEKVRALRVFADAHGHMNEALGEREILCVSQFTLYGETSRGARGGARARGVFGAHMEVELVNDGPVTLLVEVHAGGRTIRTANSV